MPSGKLTDLLINVYGFDPNEAERVMLQLTDPARAQEHARNLATVNNDISVAEDNARNQKLMGLPLQKPLPAPFSTPARPQPKRRPIAAGHVVEAGPGVDYRYAPTQPPGRRETRTPIATGHIVEDQRSAGVKMLEEYLRAQDTINAGLAEKGGLWGIISGQVK